MALMDLITTEIYGPFWSTEVSTTMSMQQYIMDFLFQTETILLLIQFLDQSLDKTI